MAYKQNNPISRGISYGPGDYQNPRNPMGSIEGTFDVVNDALKSGGKNQFNIEDKDVGSNVTGADGDETTKNKITPSDDSQKPSVPAAADLERIRKENIKEGNLQKNIMRLDKKSGELSKKEYKAQKKAAKQAKKDAKKKNKEDKKKAKANRKRK